MNFIDAHLRLLPDFMTFRVFHGWMLFTRNTRDFAPRWPEIREPYRL